MERIKKHLLFIFFLRFTFRISFFLSFINFDNEKERRKSVTCIPSGCENQSPNISPVHSSSLQENYVELLRSKEVELRRVITRAQEESSRASLLLKKKDGMLGPRDYKS